MSNLAVLPDDSVFVRDQKVFTTSLTVAEVFEKPHYNVTKHIRKKLRNYPKSFTEVNFYLSEYVDQTGKRNTLYEMTKDGFALLALGFTGQKAAQFQIAFLSEFNRRGEEIQKMKLHALPEPRKNLHAFGYHKLEYTLDGKSRLEWVTGIKRLEDMDELEKHAWLQSKRVKSGIGHIKALIANMPDNEKFTEKNIAVLDILQDLADKYTVKQVSPKLSQRLLFEDNESPTIH